MSKIKELFKEKETVYFFDVDGVLTALEYGEYNHYELDDEKWSKSLQEEDGYKNNRPIKILQKFINEKEVKNIYVITKVMNEIELEQKKKFLTKYYHIIEKNIFSVTKNEEKLAMIQKIRKEYDKKIPDKYFVMIDDSVEVLNHIMENSHFSTVHISSFFE